jgi:hypothetical protein
MSLFTEPFDPADLRAKELLAVAVTGYTEKKQLRAMVSGVGVAEIDVDWDGPVGDVWPLILTTIAKRSLLRRLVTTLRDDPNYAQVRPRIVALLEAAAEEEQAEAAGKEQGTDHTRVTVVGRRPFINRSRLRDNLKSLFGTDGDRAMIVDGPPASGRSYTWVLISHVARMTSGPETRLIDLSRFRGALATPADVAMMIAADLGWVAPKADETAQDETKGRVLLGWLKNRVSEHGAVCMVFDGLDGDNLTDATLNFIGDIAAAAGNDELGETRVVLLAFGRTLQNPNVDPFVLREPSLADIPLSELTAYLRKVAAEGGQDLSEAQAAALAAKLLGGSSPDPVPVKLLASRARAVSDLACRLRRGKNG